MNSSRVLTGKHFMHGDHACAEGAIASGCRFFGGYPITPSTEIAEHLARRLPEDNNTLLFVGYQAEGTRGRALQGGKTEIKIHGRMVPVRAHIESISSFSAHADYREILAWLMGFNRAPRNTFVVHGEPEASQAMRDRIVKQLGWAATIPELGQSFELN